MYEKSINVSITTNSKAIDVSGSANTKAISVNVDKGLPTFPEYKGETTFTPSQHEQTVQTKNTLVQSNITIKPIPNNYGLITYNGSFITVS